MLTMQATSHDPTTMQYPSLLLICSGLSTKMSGKLPSRIVSRADSSSG